MPQTIKLALLDDYQKVAMRMADWDRLKKRGVEITVFHEPFASVEDAAQKLAPFQILGLLRERTAFPRALIEKLTNLKFMVLTGARASSLDDKAATERGIPISNTPGGGSNASTAELCWALLMSCARDLAKGERLMRSGGWHDGIKQMQVLEGKRLGVLGLGRLGSRVAGYAKAFGMDVVAWSQNLTEEKAAQGGAKTEHVRREIGLEKLRRVERAANGREQQAPRSDGEQRPLVPASSGSIASAVCSKTIIEAPPALARARRRSWRARSAAGRGCRRRSPSDRAR